MTAQPGLIAPDLRRRMACWLYEGVLLFGVVFTAGLVFSIAGQMRSGADERQWLFKLFLFVICGMYFTWFWSRGQTLAMRTWEVRLVDRSGRRVTQGRAFVRYVYSWIWFIPPLAALESRRFTTTQALILLVAWVVVWALLSRFQRERQFWHDVWAGTRVVPAGAPAPAP